MPRDGAIICADLLGRIDHFAIARSKCSRGGRYTVRTLVDLIWLRRPIPDSRAETTRACRRCLSPGPADACAAFTLLFDALQGAESD